MLFLFRKKKKVKPRAKKSMATKRTAKKTVKKKKKSAGKKKMAARPRMPAKGKEVLIGKVTHYFPHVRAGAILIERGSIRIGDTVHIKGHTTDFKQSVKSLQINRLAVQKASKGKEIGLRVKARVRINDSVYKVIS